MPSSPTAHLLQCGTEPREEQACSWRSTPPRLGGAYHTRPARGGGHWLGGGFAVWQLPARPREVAVVAVGVALQVVLVLGLGRQEGNGLADLGHHFAGPQAARRRRRPSCPRRPGAARR